MTEHVRPRRLAMIRFSAMVGLIACWSNCLFAQIQHPKPTLGQLDQENAAVVRSQGCDSQHPVVITSSSGEPLYSMPPGRGGSPLETQLLDKAVRSSSLVIDGQIVSIARELPDASSHGEIRLILTLQIFAALKSSPSGSASTPLGTISASIDSGFALGPDGQCVMMQHPPYLALGTEYVFFITPAAQGADIQEINSGYLIAFDAQENAWVWDGPRGLAKMDDHGKVDQWSREQVRAEIIGAGSHP